MMSARARYYDTAPSHTGKRGLSGIINDFFRSNAAMSSNEVLPQQQRTHHGVPTSGNQDMCTKHPQSDPGGHRYLHWCFPWTRYSVRMHPLRMCHIYSDMDFFAALKTRYDATRTRSRRWLSFKKPTALRFVKVLPFSHHAPNMRLTTLRSFDYTTNSSSTYTSPPTFRPNLTKMNTTTPPCQQKPYHPSAQTSSCISSFTQKTQPHDQLCYLPYPSASVISSNRALSAVAVSDGASMSRLVLTS
jgi:hypothetical protein